MLRVSVQIQRAGKTDARPAKLYRAKNQVDNKLGQTIFSTTFGLDRDRVFILDLALP